MPIGALRLINPPGHTWRRSTFPRYAGGSTSRRSPYVNPQSDPLGIRASFYVGSRLEKRRKAAAKKVKGNPMIKRRKKVKSNRPRYKSGHRKGQFMSNAAISRSRAAKRNAAKPKANPKRKRRAGRRARKNPVVHVSKTGKRRKVGSRQLKTRKAKAAYARLKSGSLSGTEYKKEFNALWALRKEKGKLVAKKRKTKKGKRSAASYKAAARKAARTRKAKKLIRSLAAKKAASKRKRGKKTVSSAAPKTVSSAAPKRRKSRKARKSVGGRRRLSRATPIRFIYKTKKRGKTKHARVVLKKTRKSSKRRSYVRPYVKRNPGMADFKNALISGGILFGGLLGMRVLANVIKQQLFEVGKPLNTATASLGPKIVPLLPAGIVFVGSMFLGKVVKNTKIVSAAQSGAALVLLDAVFNNLIKPALIGTNTTGTIAKLLGGVNDVGYGYGRMGEYMPQQQQLLPMSGMGLDVQEAMALDEYVPDRSMGMQVEEALSESEVEGMQRGFAAGSLSRTVFSS